MGKYLKLFDTHSQYESYTADTANFIKPNVSYCIDTPNEVHYHKLECEETSVYEVIGTPTYPSTVEGDATSFDITVNYKRTDINSACTETVTEGTDIVTVEIGQNPSTASSRTVEGTYDYHGLEIAYSVTQTKFEAKLTAKFNVTDTSSPTKIVSGTNYFSAIEIDGVVQPSVTTGYTFSTIGEHTVKYTLRSPTSIGDSTFRGCSGLTSIEIPDSVTSIGYAAFAECSSLTRLNSDVDGVFNIPSGVTRIDNGAFNSCTGLTSVVISDSVASIGNAALANLSKLTSITCNATIAPTIRTDTFYGVETNGTLYVPIGSSGYDVWMGTGNYYLGMYNWTKVEQ